MKSLKSFLSRFAIAMVIALVFMKPAPEWLSDLFGVLLWIVAVTILVATVGTLDDAIRLKAAKPRAGTVQRTWNILLFMAEALAIASSGRTYLAIAWLLVLLLWLFIADQAEASRQASISQHA